MMKCLGLALLFVAMTAAVAIAATIDAGHILVTPLGPFGGEDHWDGRARDADGSRCAAAPRAGEARSGPPLDVAVDSRRGIGL